MSRRGSTSDGHEADDERPDPPRRFDDVGVLRAARWFEAAYAGCHIAATDGV